MKKLDFTDAGPDQSKRAKEADLRKVFEGYGPIERIRVVRDKKGKSRGYAFIVYERERDMKGTLILLISSAMTMRRKGISLTPTGEGKGYR